MSSVYYPLNYHFRQNLSKYLYSAQKFYDRVLTREHKICKNEEKNETKIHQVASLPGCSGLLDIEFGERLGVNGLMHFRCEMSFEAC